MRLMLFFWMVSWSSLFAEESLAEESLVEDSSDQKAVHQVLLVTAESLAEAWIPFAAWKATQGYAVEIVTVEELAKGEGSDVQEKMRRGIRKAIEEDAVGWVILGGDSTPEGGLVPDRNTMHETMWGQETDIPTDIYYLSPTNWDADGDGIYGEFQDDAAAITYPDGSVGLGRIPVRTVEDVAAYTYKVITSERENLPEEWTHTFLYTCTVEGAYPKVRRSWDAILGKVFTEGKMERYFKDETPWDEAEPGDYPLNAENWVKLFNEKRVGKMHLHGHGFLDGWVMEDNATMFGAAEVAQLTNEGYYPLITTVACFTGYFDSEQDPSIAEAMLRQPKAGALLLVAPSREGKPHFVNPEEGFSLMFSEGKLDGTTQTMTQFWKNGIADDLTAGIALMRTKATMIEKAKESANYHLCLCELNLLGDPLLKIHR